MRAWTGRMKLTYGFLIRCNPLVVRAGLASPRYGCVVDSFSVAGSGTIEITLDRLPIVVPWCRRPKEVDLVKLSGRWHRVAGRLTVDDRIAAQLPINASDTVGS